MQNEIRQDIIVGSRRFSNYFWGVIFIIRRLKLFISRYFKLL